MMHPGAVIPLPKQAFVSILDMTPFQLSDMTPFQLSQLVIPAG